MKTFFDVLYRRILYKIPLKFLLLLLCIGALLFASCNAGLVLENTFTTSDGNGNITSQYDLLCMQVNNCNNLSYTIDYIFDSSELGLGYAYQAKILEQAPNDKGLGICTAGGTIIFGNGGNCSITFNEYSFSNYTSLQCQTEYNLIPIESVDSNYCETNNLCPVYTGDCENSSGVNWSSLYINDIQHIGGPNIYITIPEEIGRDYNYNDYDDMFISVSGYNVDYDKIEGIINTQNYKPTQEDFNNIIGILADYMPIIVIFLGLLFIYSMIKKPFKSKLK